MSIARMMRAATGAGALLLQGRYPSTEVPHLLHAAWTNEHVPADVAEVARLIQEAVEADAPQWLRIVRANRKMSDAARACMFLLLDRYGWRRASNDNATSGLHVL